MFELLTDYLFGKTNYMAESTVVYNEGGKKQPQENKREVTHRGQERETGGRGERNAVLVEESSGIDRSDGKETRRRGPFNSGQDRVDAMERKLANARRDAKHDARTIDEMKQTIDKQNRRLDRMAQERDIYMQQAKDVGNKLAVSDQSSGELKQEVHRLKEWLAEYQNRCRGLEGQLQSREKEAKITQAELHEFRAQHASMLTLLGVRTTELNGAQTFLTRADSLSCAEVISMVEGLNSEMLQTAAFIADELEFEANQASPTGELEAACKMVNDQMGIKILHMLTSTRHYEDPMLIQIVVQSCLARYSSDIIEAWCFDRAPQRFLVKAYERVRKAEAQAVSGRWRALTRNHCQSLHTCEDVITSSISFTVESLVNILIVAGCKGNRQDVHNQVQNTFGDRIRLIVNLALRINRALGEQITSSDVEIVYAYEDTEFDSTVMVDICDDHTAQNRTGRVICTTELGLRQVEKETKAEGSWNVKILLKPKVALDSVADNMAR